MLFSFTLCPSFYVSITKKRAKNALSKLTFCHIWLKESALNFARLDRTDICAPFGIFHFLGHLLSAVYTSLTATIDTICACKLTGFQLNANWGQNKRGHEQVFNPFKVVDGGVATVYVIWNSFLHLVCFRFCLLIEQFPSGNCFLLATLLVRIGSTDMQTYLLACLILIDRLQTKLQTYKLLHYLCVRVCVCVQEQIEKSQHLHNAN